MAPKGQGYYETDRVMTRLESAPDPPRMGAEVRPGLGRPRRHGSHQASRGVTCEKQLDPEKVGKGRRSSSWLKEQTITVSSTLGLRPRSTYHATRPINLEGVRDTCEGGSSPGRNGPETFPQKEKQQ